MKIVLTTSLYPPEIGGPAIYAKELCERLYKKHGITVVAYTNKGRPFTGVKLLAVKKNAILPVRLWRFFRAVWKASRHVDLIYAQNAMAAGLPAALVCLLRRRPLVIKFVGDEAWERASQHHLTQKRPEEFLTKPEGNWKIKTMILIQKFVLHQANIIITPSAYLRKEIIKFYQVDPQRVVVNYNAADSPIESPFVSQPTKHQIVTTARLTAWKEVSDIIEAVAILVKKFPNIRLVIAGDGPERKKLEKLAIDLGLFDKIQFLGNISRAETWQLRKNSQIYVLNSTYEGLPHTVLTSFAAMIPVIATNISGTNEVVYHEETGLLVEPGKPEQLATAIERLFNDSLLCEKLTKNGNKLLKEKFSWETHLKKLDEIFQAAVAKPHY